MTPAPVAPVSTQPGSSARPRPSWRPHPRRPWRRRALRSRPSLSKSTVRFSAFPLSPVSPLEQQEGHPAAAGLDFDLGLDILSQFDQLQYAILQELWRVLDLDGRL